MDPQENTKDIILLFKFLKKLVTNPVESIKEIPTIKFTSLLIFQFLLCVFSVVFSNIFAPYAINFGQIIITIIASFIGLSLTSMFFYYFFLTFFGRELSFRSLFALVLFAHIPFALFHLLYYYFPVADLMGMGFSAILMIVGLTENFKLPKKMATRLLTGLYSLFFIYWIFKTISVYNFTEHSQPQNLDAIEREVKSDL